MVNQNLMGNIHTGKVIQRNFGHIQHLPGSKMINAEDKLLGQQEIDWLIKRRKDPATDIVIVTEKLDGMNAGVLKQNGVLYPLMRMGYDVRTSNISWIRGFSKFVEDNQYRFYELLNEGERVCGEWLLKTHTLQYNLQHEPFVAFDLIDDNNDREPYFEFINRIHSFGFTSPGLVHIGESIPSDMAIQIMGGGYHHVTDGCPEDVVYKYESSGRFVCSGKFVSNPNVGNSELFNMNINSNKINYTSRKRKNLYSQYMAY